LKRKRKHETAKKKSIMQATTKKNKKKKQLNKVYNASKYFYTPALAISTPSRRLSKGLSGGGAETLVERARRRWQSLAPS
jgi:hypothetical protein